MRTNMKNRIVVLFLQFFTIFAAMSLTACGGGGGNASAPSSTTTTTGATPGAVDLLTTSSTLGTGGSAITITAVVKDSGNVALANIPVTLSASSGNLLVSTANTNSSGIVTASLSEGANKSLRTITVTATAGSISRTAQISVVGTKLSISGPTTVQLGAGAQTITVHAADSTGGAVSGAQISVVSSLGNSVSNPVLTDTSGNTTFDYTPVISGSDALTISGLGYVTTYALTVSGSDFKFISPANNTPVNVGSLQAVTVQYQNNGVPQVGATINFSTTRGTLSASSTLTNGSGQATVNVSSTSAGTGTVTASLAGGGASASVPLNFVSVTPTTITLQASPSAVSPNISGSTSNRATISVELRDATANPVANKQVDFTIIADNAGAISAASATTDSSGRAAIQYIPGTGPTASNGVDIRAAVNGGSLSKDVFLTVNNSALFINVAFGSKLQEYSAGGIPVGYEQTVAVYITDSNGAAVANQDVTLSLIPTRYAKGSLTKNAAGSSSYWNVGTPASAICASEDTNHNGILDPGEDINGDGKLQPGNVGALLASTFKTDSQGWGYTTFRYAKAYALWTELRLTAQATVAGTESTRSEILWLPATVSDNDATNGPSIVWSTSPYGTASSCTVAN